MTIEGPQASRGIGRLVAGRYECVEVVRERPSAIIARAIDRTSSARVVVKLLIGTSDAGPDLRRFEREAKAAASLDHPHVARVLEYGVDGTTPFIVMEALGGEDLRECLERRGALPVEVALDYVLQACAGIRAAHARGIVHRDLKPSNLFLTQAEGGLVVVKVLDFGLAKPLHPFDASDDSSLTESKTVMGSPSYMAPEQIRNAKRVDLRADIWSIGIILYELVSGARPFQAETVAGLLASIIADEPVSLRERVPDVPRDVEALVAACLQKDPERRIGSIDDVMGVIRRLDSAPAKAAPSRSRRLPASAASGAVCLAALVVAVASGGRGAEASARAEERAGAGGVESVGAAIPSRPLDPAVLVTSAPPANGAARAAGEPPSAVEMGAAAKPIVRHAARKRPSAAAAGPSSPTPAASGSASAQGASVAPPLASFGGPSIAFRK